MSKLIEKRANRLLIIVLVLTMLLLTGLSYKFYVGRELWKKEEKVVENAGRESEVQNMGLRSFESLPAGFPKDFPVYQNATLTSGWEKGKDEGYVISVVWETDDLPQNTFYFFDDELKSFDWAITSSVNSKDSYTISFTKEKISGFLGITKGEKGKTLISVTLNIE